MELNSFDTFTSLVGHGEERNVLFRGDLGEDILVFLSEVFIGLQVGLTENNAEGLVLEKRLDGVEQADLLFDTVRALFGHIDEEEDTSLQVSQSSDTLHFNGVTLFQGVIQDTGGIDNLPSHVLVIGMTNVERLGGERITLDFDISLGDRVNETTLTDIGVTGNHQSSFEGIDGGQSCQMLSNFFQII